MDVNDKDSNSVIACSPLSLREYSPSPSTTNNNTPSTTNTTSTTNRSTTPTPTTLPITINNNISNHPTILKIESLKSNAHTHTIRPLLTSMNNNININMNTNTSIPRIPLPNMMPKFGIINNNLSLPPLPNEKHNYKNRHKKSQFKIIGNIKSKSKLIKPSELSKSKSKSKSKNKSQIKMEIDNRHDNETSTSPEEYTIIRSAFNHNLRVKQEHLHREIINDISFDQCFIFSMRCPYSDCCKLFNNMVTYQNHHIKKHQLRDKKGKLIQSKEAKWTCPECGKISASWYNYAAHVTMHKDSCDAPWICKLPPMNKKKYIKWTDGTLICGKRCSTKHNLIKHLKALHTNHRIVDLSQSVKAQSIKATESSSGRARHRMGSRRISPRKTKKRPRFTNVNDNSYYNKHNSVPILQPPPKKRLKMINRHNNIGNINILPIYSTGDNLFKNKKSVQQQSDFVGLLLEAAQLIETEPNNNKNNDSSDIDMTITAENINKLLNSIKNIFNSNSNNGLLKAIDLENFNELSAVLAITNALKICDNNNEEMNSNNNNTSFINISNITDISSISIPQIESNYNYKNKISNVRIMPDINIISSMPKLYSNISPITPTNPLISLPKLPLPPPPPQISPRFGRNNYNNISENGNGNVNGLESLLKILNKNKSQIPIHHYRPPQIPQIMVNTNTFNTYNNFPLPLLPNLNENMPIVNANKNNNSYLPNQNNILPISQSQNNNNNILSTLPLIQ